MRLIVIPQPVTDLRTLSASLSAQPEGGRAAPGPLTEATLAQIRTLNPHVDLLKMDAGTVLLLPDSPELDGADSRMLADEAFQSFATHVNDGLQDVAQRARTSAEARNADRTDVSSLLKIAAVKRQIDSDALLKKQFDAAQDESATVQKQTQEDIRQLEKMQKDTSVELKALGKTLGQLR